MDERCRVGSLLSLFITHPIGLISICFQQKLRKPLPLYITSSIRFSSLICSDHLITVADRSMLPREFPGSLDVQGQFRPGTNLDLNSSYFTGRPLLQGVDSLFDDYQGSQMPEFDFNRKLLDILYFLANCIKIHYD